MPLRIGIAVACSTQYHWTTGLTSRKTSRSSDRSEIRVMRYCCASHVRYASETDASAQPPGISKPTGRPSRTMSSGSFAERIRNRMRGAFFRKKAT
jgi:hypothetical protein